MMTTETIRIQGEESYDVVVCGGGTAGFCAAVAAAREGARTALLETFGMLGGTMTVGGIVQGYPDGSFRPRANITRAEFAAMAVRFFDVEYDGPDLFSDTTGHWASDLINKAASAGIILGFKDGTFRPDQDITRAEAIAIFNRVLGRAPDKDHLLPDMITWPDNMDTDAWYYANMQEATNSHDYDRVKAADGTEYEVWTKILPVRDWAAFETHARFLAGRSVRGGLGRSGPPGGTGPAPPLV